MDKQLFSLICGLVGLVVGWALDLPVYLDGWLRTAPLAGLAGFVIGRILWSYMVAEEPLVNHRLTHIESVTPRSSMTPSLTPPGHAYQSSPDALTVQAPAGEPVTTPGFNSPSVTAETVCAGFGPRFVAQVIDIFLLLVPNFVLLLILPSLLALLAFFVVEFLYCAWFWTETGATPGKAVMGLRVVDKQGQLLDLPQALARYAATLLSLYALWLGYLWVIWDPKHEAWHDKIAGTKVIRVR